MGQGIYAQPRLVTDVSECYFYHTMDIPGYGCVKGEWDLRGREKDYLGGGKLSRQARVGSRYR
ncbi:MAG TPA: hypothetical protein VGW33_09595 [Terriglobia bacterium]|nr:hypothetical protein [Terriglobia bacterium]